VFAPDLSARHVRRSVRSLDTYSAGASFDEISVPTVDGPQTYALSEVPRSIRAEDVQRMLGTVDRRTIVGKRDFAMLLLLAVYGLRAREVASLTLDDLDWEGWGSSCSRA